MKKSLLLIILIILIVTIISTVIICVNLTKDFGINNLGKSLIALYQIKMNDTDYVKISENVYMVKNAEIANNMSYISDEDIKLTSPSIFKARKNKFLYSIVEFSKGTTGFLGPNIVLKVNILLYQDLDKEYTLSREESSFLYALIANMECRNYTCDGIANYQFKIMNKNYGIEIYDNEIHIIPYNDNIDNNEAVITGEDYTKLKEILNKYPQNKT